MLRMIARSPLMKVYANNGARYQLQDGTPVATKIATTLIEQQWAVPKRDGLPMFEETQTYVARIP